MESVCLPHTLLPHTSRLFADFQYNFDRVARFYAGSPHALESFRAAAARIDLPADRRAALIAALKAQNGDSPALARLAEPGVTAVITGQQAGLYSGPCYTVYKAITAALLARHLSENGVPAVPVFWTATEDHDFAEVNHCWVFDGAHRPVRLGVPGTNAERRPVGTIPLSETPLSELAEAIGGFPFGDEVIAIVRDAYAPGRTLGDAFTALLRQVLAPFGLLFFDPMHPASRALAAPLLSAAVEAAPALSARLLERNRELAAAGYHAQVLVDERTSLFFLLENGKRLAPPRDAAGLADRGAELSPNALLRPVVQDFMFPTVAYVGGPAEIAYFAQSQVIYETLGRPQPVPVHRQSVTLLDGRAAKLLKRYGLTLSSFFDGEEALRGRIAATLVSPELTRAIEQTRTGTTAALDSLDATLRAFDPTLAAAFEKSRRKINWQITKTERKAAREALRRNERASADAARLIGLIYPEKRLQERFYTILPFLAKHGLDAIDNIAAALRLDCPDHRVVTL